MSTTTHAPRDRAAPGDPTGETLEREVAAQVTQLAHLTNVLKRRLTVVLRSGKGQAPHLAAKRVAILKDRVGRSIASVQATLDEAETLSNAPSTVAAAPSAAKRPETASERAALLVVAKRWTPTQTELQRGRAALLDEFEQPYNLPVAEFSRLVGKSRQQVYKDLHASPPRLLALSAGARGQRLPEWQLDERGRLLTQHVMRAATALDAWTIYNAIRQPAGALGGRSPAEAAMKGTPAVEEIADLVLELLGIYGSDAKS